MKIAKTENREGGLRTPRIAVSTDFDTQLHLLAPIQAFLDPRIWYKNRFYHVIVNCLSSCKTVFVLEC